MFKILSLIGVIGYTLLIAGCSQEPAVDLQPASPQEFVTAALKQIAVPGFEKLAQRSAAFQQSVEALCTTPGDSQLAAARDSWRGLSASWRSQRPLMFGPARDMNVRRSIDHWPPNDVVAHAAIQPGAEIYTREERSARGFAAAEFLLFGDTRYPVGVAQWHEPGRCTHMRDINAEIARLSTEILRRWNRDFADMMIEGDPSAAASLIIAETLNTTEAILWQRLGVPTNFFRGNPKPEQLEAWRSGESLAGIKASLRTIEQLIGGTHGQAGIASLLIATEPDKATSLIEASRLALATADSIPAPLRNALGNGETEDLFNAVQDLKNELLDTAALLGLSIQFESDGD